MNTASLMLVTLLLGFIVFVLLIPHGNREWLYGEIRRFASLAQVGGYVHDTAMSQYIPPTAAVCITGTWTEVAGAVAGTICKHVGAAAQTATVYIPVPIPSNSVAGKGALLKSVELDYELAGQAATSVTLSIHKVVRGADGADAVVSAPAGTQTLTPNSGAETIDEHRDAFTLTTPAYIDNDEYYYLKAVIVQQASTTVDILAAVANYTLRV